MNPVTTVHTMTFDGGIACFDFINSGYDRNRGVITERLHTYDDLLTLVKRLKLFDENTVANLKKLALADENATNTALDRTRQIRSLLYQLFEGIALQQTEKMDQRLLEETNLVFAEALQFKVLAADVNQLRFKFDAQPAELMAPVWKFEIGRAHV